MTGYTDSSNSSWPCFLDALVSGARSRRNHDRIDRRADMDREEWPSSSLHSSMSERYGRSSAWGGVTERAVVSWWRVACLLFLPRPGRTRHNWHTWLKMSLVHIKRSKPRSRGLLLFGPSSEGGMVSLLSRSFSRFCPVNLERFNSPATRTRRPSELRLAREALGVRDWWKRWRLKKYSRRPRSSA